MRWQKPLRWLVAAAGIGTAVTLYVQMRERPPVDRPPVATPADPDATVQSGAGTLVRFRGPGDVEFEFSYERARKLADGRMLYDKAKLRIDDGTFLAADEIEGVGESADGIPNDLRLRGNVQMDTSEGAAIRARQATYNHTTGVAVMPGPVTFARGRMSGGGTDGEYHRDTGVFHLRADATVTGAADRPEDAVEARATAMTFNRAALALLLEGNARIEHTRQTMTADRATLYLAEDQDQFRVVELRGEARVTPKPGEEASVPTMRARDIDLAFHEGTQALERALLAGEASLVLAENGSRRSIEAREVSITTAPDGRTLTRLEGRDNVTVRTPAREGQAARTITAPRLVATGDDARGLTSAVFSGGARLEERGASARGGAPRERTGTARTLSMKLGGNLDAVEEAHFEQDVTFRDGDVTGDADLGTYGVSKGQLTLRPAPRVSRAPRVTSGRVTVDARELIDVDLETQDLHAVGDVKTVNTPAPDAATRKDTSAGLFTDGETMLGFGAEFWYDNAKGRARYRGTRQAPARLTQGDTTVAAESVELSEQTRDLTAAGAVDSAFMATAQGDAAPKRYRVTADSLEYKDSARTADYAGAPVTLTGTDGTTTARTMVMTLAPEGRQLERLDARGDVHTVLEQQGREAYADTLLYESALSRYTLRGQPLRLRAAGDKPGTCSLWQARMCHFPAGGGSPECPPDERAGLVERRDVACTGPLQK